MRTAEYQIGHSVLQVMYQSITSVVAEVLVSSDDNYLTMGGGVSSALARAAGDTLREEARKHIPLKLGDVAVTSAGKLKAKYVFHAITIDRDRSMAANEENLRTATRRWSGARGRTLRSQHRSTGARCGGCPCPCAGCGRRYDHHDMRLLATPDRSGTGHPRALRRGRPLKRKRFRCVLRTGSGPVGHLQPEPCARQSVG